jgi:hypothetical protein
MARDGLFAKTHRDAKKRGGGRVEDQTPSADVSVSAADDLQNAK